MAAPLTGVLAWPAIGFVAIVLVGRMALVRDTVSDRLLNRMFLWSLAGLLLYRCATMPGMVGLAHQLALGCNIMVFLCVYGIALLWQPEADSASVSRRQWICVVVAGGCVGVMLLAGTSARNDDRMVDLTLDLEGIVVWTAYVVPLAVTAFLITRWCVREIRFGDLTGRAKFVCYGLIGGNVVLAVNWSISLVQLAVGSSPLGSHPLRMELAFTICIVNDAAFLGMPVLRSLIVRAGWDRDGRRCRRLRPLWRDLTAALPQIVMPPVPQARIQDGGPSRLFRMSVEIRDALLQLGPYFHAAPVGNGALRVQPGPEGDMAYYVQRLDYAVQARKAGVAPADSAAVPQLPRAGSDFSADLQQLLDLAMAWSKRSPDHGSSRLPAVSGQALVGGTTKS